MAIVDEDPNLDDLLGVGTTAADGTFRLSFTTDAFNQEAAEQEKRPDIYLVISLVQEETLVPVLRRDFGKLAFASAALEEDLGTTTLPLDLGHKPLRLSSHVAPGRGKIVRRTRLDDTVVQAAAREIAPLVERLTGWSGLLEGVRFDVVDDPAVAQLDQVARSLGQRDLSERERAVLALVTLGCGSMAAIWDHAANAVHLYRPALESQNFDYLKVAIGHELVHVGQSRYHPELAVIHARYARTMVEHLLARRLAPLDTLRQGHGLMANIEGYAAYIERRYLRAIYTHARSIADLTEAADEHFRELTIARNLGRFELPPIESISPAEQAERAMYSKQAQYESGLAAYVSRTDGEQPAPFDPALRPELTPEWGKTIAMLQSLLQLVK